MNREFEFYHGLVLARLVHRAPAALSLAPFSAESHAGYVINGNLGLYVKHCSHRMTPWRFTFLAEHRGELAAMHNKVDALFIALVCHKDGIACLSYSELLSVSEHDGPEWIRASRQKREMYAIKGPRGMLATKIGAPDFPGRLFKIAYSRSAISKTTRTN